MNYNQLVNFMNHPATPILIGLMVLIAPSSSEEIYGVSVNTIKNAAATVQIAKGIIDVCKQLTIEANVQLPEPSENSFAAYNRMM